MNAEITYTDISGKSHVIRATSPINAVRSLERINGYVLTSDDEMANVAGHALRERHRAKSRAFREKMNIPNGNATSDFLKVRFLEDIETDEDGRIKAKVFRTLMIPKSSGVSLSNGSTDIVTRNDEYEGSSDQTTKKEKTKKSTSYEMAVMGLTFARQGGQVVLVAKRYNGTTFKTSFSDKIVTVEGYEDVDVEKVEDQQNVVYRVKSNVNIVAAQDTNLSASKSRSAGDTNITVSVKYK